MLKGSHHPTEKNQTYACWTWFQFLGQFCPTQEHLCLAILTWWAHESYKGEDSCTALWYLVSLGSICRINPSAVTLWLLIWSWHIVWVLKFGSCPNTEIFPSHSTFTLGYMISTIAAIASVLLQFFSTTSTDILLESQWGCPHVLLPSDYRKETVGSASAKAVDDCGWMKVHFQCHCTVAAEPQRPTCWGEALRTLTSNRITGSSGWLVFIPVHRDRGILSLCICKVKAKGGSSSFSFLQCKVSPTLAAGMQLHSFCVFFTSHFPSVVQK